MMKYLTTALKMAENDQVYPVQLNTITSLRKEGRIGSVFDTSTKIKTSQTLHANMPLRHHENTPI